jgi:hypothetical protein
VLTAERATAPMLTLERLANCKVRLAGELVETDAGRAKQLLDQAEETLKHLLALGETAERWSLMGGLMKRRFLLSKDSSERRHALREMSRAAENASVRSRAAGNDDLTYPLSNQVAAEIVLAWRSRNGKGHKAALSEQLSSLQQAASAAVGSHTDYR